MARYTLVGALLVVTGCGGAPAPRVTADPAPERCVLRGEADALLLTVDGLPDRLAVYGLPTEVTLDGERAIARVSRPLAFTGLGDTEAVHAHVAQPTSGAIALDHGAPMRSLRMVSATSLEAMVVLSGADAVDDALWRGVAVRTELPCATLGLGIADDRFGAGETPMGRILVGEQDLPLRALPGGPVVGVLRLALDEGEERRMVEVLEERDGEAHIRRRFSYGTVDGWVDAARVGPTPMGLGRMSVSGHGGGSGCGRSHHPYSYRGRARVRAGTDVRAEATGRVWAVVSEDVDAEVGVRASGEVEIIDIEGLRSERCGNLELDLAIVPASAVVLPAP